MLLVPSLSLWGRLAWLFWLHPSFQPKMTQIVGFLLHLVTVHPYVSIGNGEYENVSTLALYCTVGKPTVALCEPFWCGNTNSIFWKNSYHTAHIILSLTSIFSRFSNFVFVLYASPWLFQKEQYLILMKKIFHYTQACIFLIVEVAFIKKYRDTT